MEYLQSNMRVCVHACVRACVCVWGGGERVRTTFVWNSTKAHSSSRSCSMAIITEYSGKKATSYKNAKRHLEQLGSNVSLHNTVLSGISRMLGESIFSKLTLSAVCTNFKVSHTLYCESGVFIY